MSGLAAADIGGAPDRLRGAIERLARDGAKHVLTGPAQPADLVALERTLALALPASFRTYLGRLGAGILYDRHEVFGPVSLQIHDIEFVPSLPAIVKQLCVGVRLLPFHRGNGHVHAFDLGGGAGEPVPVRALDGPATYRDLAAFLEAVVLPDRS